MADPFLLDPENADFAAGRTRALSYSNCRLMLAFGLLFWAFGSIFVVFLGREWWHYLELRSRGQELIGRVVALDAHHDEGTTYTVRFTYQPPGQPELSGITQIGKSAYHALTVNGPVELRYSPARPEIVKARGAAWHSFWPLAGMTLFLLVWHALPGILVVTSAVDWRRRFLMRREAIILPGTALKVTPTYDSDNDLQLTIQFRFQPPDGPAVVAEESATRTDLMKGTIPREGAALRVAYARGKHLLL